MSALRRFLAAKGSDLGIEQHDVGPESDFVLLTPRFGASRHVVFIVLSRRSRRPALVAKIPRLEADSDGITREATILRELERRGLSERGLAPRVVALEDAFFGHGLLLETALVGRPVDPAFVRRSPERAIDAVIGSLELLADDDGSSREADAESFARLVRGPLLSLGRRFAADDVEQRLVEETLEITRPLARGVPGVMEHGDVSHPNLIWLGDGRVGLVDWELANLHGLPLHDLFFFLAYVASARARARAVEEHVRAFRSAFIGPSAWARPVVRAYAERVGVAQPLIALLLVACWARYAVDVLSRSAEVPRRSANEITLTLDEKRALRERREYVLWRYVVANLDDLAV